MHLQSVYNSLPPPTEAKHYTACELSDVLELCNERILGFHPGLPHTCTYTYTISGKFYKAQFFCVFVFVVNVLIGTSSVFMTFDL